MKTPHWDALGIATLIFTIAAPVIAGLIKAFNGGWLIIVFIVTAVGPIVCLAGWVVLTLIAVFVGRNADYRWTSSRLRGAIIAALWTTGIGNLVFASSVLDTGDSSEQWSFLTNVLGASETTSTAVAWVSVVVWIGGWLLTVVLSNVARVRTKPTYTGLIVQPAPRQPGA